jgi:PilZ domain
MSALSRFPWGHRIDTPTELERKDKNHSAVTSVRIIPDPRRQPRFKIEIPITINSRTSGVLNGTTVDISESGIVAILPIEVPLGENVELNFTLPSSPVTISAMVRQRNAFRYGFEFVHSDSMHEFIRRTCRDLAIDQSLTLV